MRRETYACTSRPFKTVGDAGPRTNGLLVHGDVVRNCLWREAKREVLRSKIHTATEERVASSTGKFIDRALIFCVVQALCFTKQRAFAIFPSIIKTNKSLVGEAFRLPKTNDFARSFRLLSNKRICADTLPQRGRLKATTARWFSVAYRQTPSLRLILSVGTTVGSLHPQEKRKSPTNRVLPIFSFVCWCDGTLIRD